MSYFYIFRSVSRVPTYESYRFAFITSYKSIFVSNIWIIKEKCIRLFPIFVPTNSASFIK